MLNVESVDFVKYSNFAGCHKVIEILFTDSNYDEVITIKLLEQDAQHLSKMIMEKTSYAAKLKKED